MTLITIKVSKYLVPFWTSLVAVTKQTFQVVISDSLFESKRNQHGKSNDAGSIKKTEHWQEATQSNRLQIALLDTTLNKPFTQEVPGAAKTSR